MTARTENAAPQTKYLKDYAAPDFLVDEIDLSFDLRDGETTVRALTTFRRNDHHTDRPLVLDGEQLELKDIKLDGKHLDEDAYSVDDTTLTVHKVPEGFTLETVCVIKPEENTELSGLYRSGGTFCTQCEAEGFRKITYYPDRPDVMAGFSVRMEADRESCPVLLSNGNLVEEGDAGDGRHYAVWKDPFPKPSYLFALVAGTLGHVHDTFTTMSGREVDLYIYVDPGNEDKCAHAMESLKKSMKWDEEKYGREYDLDLFNIVAVNDFNFGAMENKSLNIFNSKYVLANAETATDQDFLNIEGIVAHEYFHNWTGNRITCRDWFQLSLKEGLTVFRDQCFSADMNDEAVQRISDVEMLRNHQFPEDGGPLAHPVRPDNYIEINNFYTATVYEKGAEVIRMMHSLLGPENYRKGTDLYFDRHDGQAVTCDDFAQCMQDASGIDLSRFKLWYSQAGTPRITASGAYDEASQTYRLKLRQDIPDTPGQTDKKPMHIPVAIGLLGPNGHDMLPEETQILHLREKEQEFEFKDISSRPVPSILRRFSAPARLETDASNDDLRFLMTHDSDGFNRWEAGQSYAARLILDLAEDHKTGKALKLDDGLIDAFRANLRDSDAGPALTAKALTLPGEQYLWQFVETIHVDSIHAARKFAETTLAETLRDDWLKTYQANRDDGAYSVDPQSVGRRKLMNTALHYLLATPDDETAALADAQYKDAGNMTDRIAALSALGDTDRPERDAAFADFYETWKDDQLVTDKWFTLQAVADRPDTVEQVRELMQHPAFTLKNPNRVRSLLGAFCSANAAWFHREDGAGYAILSDTVIKLNTINPMVAARMLTPMRQWRMFDDTRKHLIQTELNRILETEGLSSDVYEIVSKSLEQK